MRLSLDILTPTVGPACGSKAPPSATAKDASPTNLIDQFLARQRDLTAVETFARRHDAHDVQAAAGRYRDLIPLTAPTPGRQYAFDVDLDACSGCKACVTACHTLNGLDDDETWRSVGLLVGGGTDGAPPIARHVTSACHHCLEPACMDGCPVLAYEKDPVTGIVRHLDDQCIGCQYCVLKCPYDVPKYNKSKGIVRKCDMCGDRLATGEAPACVQGCPNAAIRVKLVDVRQIVDESESRTFVPGAADPDYTLPSTTYKSARPLPRNTRPADDRQVSPEHAHWSLIVMLVLTQLSVGTFAIGQLAGKVVDATALATLRPAHALLALALGHLALAASTLHLGRPLYAFRAVLGLRTSWLSREILTFGLFAALATAYAAACFFAPPWLTDRHVSTLGTAVAISGILGVLCSVMIYHDTRRAFWHARYTATKFALSAVMLGAATTALAAVIATAFSRAPAVESAVRTWTQFLCRTVMLATAVKIALGLLTFRYLRARGNAPMKRTAMLLAGPLRQPVIARLATAAVGGLLLPGLSLIAFHGPLPVPPEGRVLIAASFVFTLASELIERYLFFTAVIAPRMPGGLAA